MTSLSQREIDQFTYRPSVVYDKRVQQLGLQEVEETLPRPRKMQRPVAGAKKKSIGSYAQY